MSSREMHKVSSFVTKKLLSGDAECSLRIQPFHLATRNVPSGEERGETAAMYSQATMSAAIKSSKCLLVRPRAQGPEEMYLSLEHQNPSKTSEKMANNKVDLADLGQIRSEEIVYCTLIIKIPLIWAN